AIGETLSGKADSVSPMADKAKGVPFRYSTTSRWVVLLPPAYTRTA
ncbi:MAG: hypothetical protein JWP58_2523, partial [Hymenobacter sp.]|nr:hypothetical protein [Hymenobacter sp.]